MTDRNDARDADVELLRGRLNHLVEDVEPRGDALPRLLSAARRRRRLPRRPLFAAGGAAVAATAVFLVVLLVFPVGSGSGTEPVSVRPNSYVAAAEDGVIATFDVVTGRRIEEVGRVLGEVAGPLTADGQRVFAVVANDSRRDVVEVVGSGRVASLPPDSPATALTAGGGLIAHLDGDAVAITGPGTERRIAVPAGRAVVDLALDARGRLAVLTTTSENGGAESGRATVHVVEPGASSMTERPAISAGAGCGALAVAWSERDVAVARPVDCGSPRTRITILDGDSGAQLGAGVPFETGPLATERVQLSTDRLGRFLLSTADSRQWLVDSGRVLTVPAPCTSAASCAGAPGTFWG